MTDSWIATLPNAHVLFPCLPKVETTQMRLLTALLSHISTVTSLRSSTSFSSLQLADMLRWYRSFPKDCHDEREEGLLAIWRKCLSTSSDLPCVPTRLKPQNPGVGVTFKSLFEEFYIDDTAIHPNWAKFIQQGLEHGTFQFYQIARAHANSFKSFLNENNNKSSALAIMSNINTMSSMEFINSLLESISDENIRFSLALELLLSRKQNENSAVWILNSGSTFSTLSQTAIFTKLPPQWLPVHLHDQYFQIASKQTAVPERFGIRSIFSISAGVELDSRLLDILDEFRCESIKSLIKNHLLQSLIKQQSRHEYDEMTAREFAGPYGRLSQCTGWGSRKGYQLTDWVLTPFALELRGSVLPFLLKNFLEDSSLQSTFYRSARLESNVSGHRPTQWVRDIAPFIPNWIRTPSLRPLCEKLIEVCEKEGNILNMPKVQSSISETNANTRLPHPPLDELKRRDTVMRSWFTNRDWSQNAEYLLKRSFVLSSKTFLPDYPLLIDDEWEVISNRTDCGRGDLLFCSEDGKFVAVIELKANSSSTAESVRTQARSYAKLYHQLYEVKGVRGYIVRTQSTQLNRSDLEHVCEFGRPHAGDQLSLIFGIK